MEASLSRFLFVSHQPTKTHDTAQQRWEEYLVALFVTKNRRQTWRNTLQTFDHEFHEVEMWYPSRRRPPLNPIPNLSEKQYSIHVSFTRS